MSTKVFLSLLAGVLLLGGTLGGAFVGGVALGKSQGNGAPQASTQAPSQSDGIDLDRLREQIQSGQLRAQFRGQGGAGRFGGGGGGGGLSGILETLDGSTVTVNTSQGPLQVTIGEETIIQVLASATRAALEVGMHVTVVGQRGEDGTFVAGSVVVTPEGAEGLFGGGSRRNRDQQLQ